MSEFKDEPTPVDHAIPTEAAAHRNAEARARRLKEITTLHHDDSKAMGRLLERLRSDTKFQQWFVEDVTGLSEQEQLLADAINLLSQQLERTLAKK